MSDLFAPARKWKAVTTADVKLALRRVYSQPEWALLFEVGDATGARHTRFADALAMSLWPSRGLTLTGMEIKVSRSDWHKERQQPEKAETIAAFCDYWTLVTAPKVVLDASEVPPAWGWMEFDGDRFRTMRDPAKTDAAPMTRTFLAALLRRAHKADEAVVDAEVARRREVDEITYNDRVEAAAARRAEEAAKLAENVKQFEEASGIELSKWSAWGGEARELGRAAKALRETGIASGYDNLHSLSRRLRDMSASIDKAMADLNLPAEQPLTALRKAR